jgi:hypothetical protein
MSTKRTNLKLTLCVGSAIAALLVTQPAHAFAFGHMGGLGGAMPQMGGLPHMGSMPQMGGLSHVGGLSQMGGVSHLGGLPQVGHMGNLANGPHIEAAKHGDLPVVRGNPGKSLSNVADRNVGGGIKEKVGTATHDKDGRPIGGSSYDPATGNTTTSVKAGNGTHAITVTDKDGKTIATGTSGKAPIGGSSTQGGSTTTSVSNGDGTRTVTTSDGKGNSSSYVSGRPPEGHVSVPDGHGGWKRYTPDVDFVPVVPNVAVVPDLPDLSFVPGLVSAFGPPDSGSSTYGGTTVTVTGIGTDHKTVKRTDKDGNVKIIANVPAAAAVAAPDIGTAVVNLIEAMKKLAAAKAEARSAHLSLDSIVSSDNLPDDVKANIPDALNRAADADSNVKAATQDAQKALIDLQQQVAAHG